MQRTFGLDGAGAIKVQTGYGATFRLFAALFVAVFAFSGIALAQGYPTGQIRFIVPFPPGGATDLIGRQVAEGLARRLNQTVIVDNRAGAAGAIGVRAAASATPDGYTLVLAASSNVAADPVQENLPYKPATDLKPIAPVSALPYVIFANPSFAPNTVGEMIAAARKAPGTIKFASSGLGAPPHIASELLRARADIDLVHVPYKGAVPAVTDVVSGQVQFMTGDAGTALPFIESKQLKAIAVTGKQRIAMLPNVPTVAESGLPGYEAEGWFGVFAPANTPAAVANRLSQEIGAIVQEPAFIEFLGRFGARPLRMNGEEFVRFIQSETKMRSELITSRGIKLE